MCLSSLYSRMGGALQKAVALFAAALMVLRVTCGDWHGCNFVPLLRRVLSVLRALKLSGTFAVPMSLAALVFLSAQEPMRTRVLFFIDCLLSAARIAIAASQCDFCFAFVLYQDDLGHICIAS